MKSGYKTKDVKTSSTSSPKPKEVRKAYSPSDEEVRNHAKYCGLSFDTAKKDLLKQEKARALEKK